MRISAIVAECVLLKTQKAVSAEPREQELASEQHTHWRPVTGELRGDQEIVTQRPSLVKG